MTPNPTVAKFATVICHVCHQPILETEQYLKAPYQHLNSSDCVRKTREATARRCAEIAWANHGSCDATELTLAAIRKEFNVSKETTNAE